MALQSTSKLFRGGTVYFASNFFDINFNPTQPSAAAINIDYPNPDGSRAQVDIPMTPGSLTTPWTAYWDTRNIGVGTVYYSVHSVPPTPSAAGDGQFQLTANPANLVSF